jgi:hypothetical protein
MLQPIGTVRTTARVRVRHPRPSTAAPIVRGLEPGVPLAVIATVRGDVVSGNDVWFQISDGFVWSGACTELVPPPAPTGLPAPGVDWPLDRNRIRRGLVNHTFGLVRKNRDGTPRPHQGWDLAAEVGTPCYAVADGEVTDVDPEGRGDYGRTLTLRVEVHGVERWVFYAHLDTVTAAEGAKVRLGDPIGTTGNTGNAFTLDDADDHLHFELRTEARPGRGLVGRVSPAELFGAAPMHREARRESGGE